MRIQLGLHHAQLRLVELSLPGHGTGEVGLVFIGHMVEAVGQTPQLVFPAGVQMNVKIAFAYLAHGLVQLPDRTEEMSA